MVDIISKRDGPRREDVEAKRLIEANRGTIERLADRFSNGAYSARKTAATAEGAAPAGVIIHTARRTTLSGTPRPFVRIAINGRVSVVDANSGRQLHHVGDLRRQDKGQCFRLATRENGFFSPVDSEVAAALSDLDGQAVDRTSETQFTTDIAARLGFA